MSDRERNLASSRLEIEAAKSDTALISALTYLGTLRELDLSDIEQNLRAPLARLFGYTCERIALGGREPDLPRKVGSFFKDQPGAADWMADTDVKHTVASFIYLVEIARLSGFPRA